MRILAGLISLGRLLFGVAFIAKPTLMGRAWIGNQARLPGPDALWLVQSGTESAARTAILRARVY